MEDRRIAREAGTFENILENLSDGSIAAAEMFENAGNTASNNHCAIVNLSVATYLYLINLAYDRCTDVYNRSCVLAEQVIKATDWSRPDLPKCISSCINDHIMVSRICRVIEPNMNALFDHVANLEFFPGPKLAIVDKYERITKMMNMIDNRATIEHRLALMRKRHPTRNETREGLFKIVSLAYENKHEILKLDPSLKDIVDNHINEICEKVLYNLSM